VEGAGAGLPNNPAEGAGANPKLLVAGAVDAPNKPLADAGVPKPSTKKELQH